MQEILVHLLPVFLNIHNKKIPFSKYNEFSGKIKITLYTNSVYILMKIKDLGPDFATFIHFN